MAIQWVAKLSGFRGCQVVSSLSCLMQIYGFYRDLQTTLFHSVAEARFPGGEDDLARGGVTGVPAGDLIIINNKRCMEMLRNEKITVLRKRENPDSQSFICLQTEVCTGVVWAIPAESLSLSSD